MRRLDAALAIGSTVLAMACSTILGLQEPTIDNTIGDAANVETSIDGDGSGDGGGAATQLLAGHQVRVIAIDDTNIFYSEPFDAVVGRMAKDGSSPLDLANGNLVTGFFPDSVTLDATDVFWRTGGGIYQCKKTGCSNSPTRIIDDQDPDASVSYSIEAIAVDDQSTIYFGDQDINGATFIRSVPKGAPNGTVTTILTGTQFALCPTLDQLVYDSSYLYFTCGEGPVGRITPSTKGIEVLTNAAPPPSAANMVIFGSTIFYTQQQPAGSVFSLPIAVASPSTPLVLSQDNAYAVAADQQYLYWTVLGVKLNGTDGAVVRCKPSTCSTMTQTVVGNLDGPTSMVLDQSYIYFSEYGISTTTPDKRGIFRIAKAP